MDKKNKIENIELEQNNLRKKVLNLKSRVPKFVISLLLLVVLVIFFFEDKLYPYFKTGLNFIQFMIAFFILASVLFIIYNKSIISKYNNKIKKLGMRLYELMKLNKKESSE